MYQKDYSIIINATGDNLNNTEEYSFVVKPIRESSGNQVLLYNDSTGEITRNNDVSLNDININGTIKLKDHAGNLGDILISQGPNDRPIWSSPPIGPIYAQLSPVNPPGNSSSDISLSTINDANTHLIIFRTDISSGIIADSSTNITITDIGVYLINATITVKKNGVDDIKPKLVNARLYKSDISLIGGAEWEEEESSGEATVNVHFTCIHKTTSNDENINLKLTVQSYGGSDEHLILSQEYTKITIVKIA